MESDLLSKHYTKVAQTPKGATVALDAMHDE